MSASENLSTALQDALHHVGQALSIPLRVVLWDGSEVALSDVAMAAGETLPTLTIRSPGVVASLLKRVSLENLVRHYAVGNIAVDGDLMAIGDALSARVRKKDVRQLNKGLLLRKLWPFLFVRGEKATTRHDYGQGATEHANVRNQDYIQFHYDVGNEFYALFLDPEMLYSCAYFKDWNGTLEQAQLDKLDMICRKLRLQEGEKFLDVGCGWGGLLCHAAQHYGVQAHGITLSQEQYEFTKAKISRLGLEGQVTVEIRDYLALEGSYDKISSIGMFEHVGIANFPTYFRKINSLLKDNGLFLNHAIARRGKRDQKAALTRITPEKRLILKYIFPGSELSPIGHSVNVMEAYGFEIHDVEAWREHYALTTRRWCERLQANRERAIAMVGLERYNLWIAYLAGVSFGFASGSILIFQTLGSKRGKQKGASGLPPTRADLYR
jgi:cyclopropane-fatty-acyl-phospholipid synthase